MSIRCMMVMWCCVLCLSVPSGFSAWHVEIVDSGTDVGRSNSIAVDINERVHISYFKDDNSSLKYARQTDSGWEFMVLDVAGTVGMFPSMVLKNGLYPFISYTREDTRELRLAYYQNNDWNIDIVPTGHLCGPKTQLRLNAQGYPMIAYHTADANQWLNLAYKNATGWQTNEFAYDVESFDFHIDLSNYLQMVYMVHPTGNTTRIRMAKAFWPPGTTNYETILDSNDMLFHPAFLWNWNDYISHICFGNADQAALQYGRLDTSSWEWETVDTVYPSAFPCMVVDSLGNPHILYGDALEGTLKYAWRDAAGWNVETVISEGGTGRYNSLALDSQDMAHVTTYEHNQKNLVYARRYFPTPTPTPPPTPTPTSQCTELGVSLQMPSTWFTAGDPCYTYLYLCNPDGVTYADTPIFVILDILGAYFFAPAFSGFDHYTQSVTPGVTRLTVLPEFIWPSDAGEFSGAIWYAAMTDTSITNLFGEMDMVTFGWGF